MLGNLEAPLNEVSLEDAILEIKRQLQDKTDLLSVRPSYIFIRADLAHWLDRLVNPWKGKRVAWLYRKRNRR